MATKPNITEFYEDKDLGYSNLRAFFRENSKGTSVKAGILKKAGKHNNSDTTVAQIMAIHELGAPNAGIPERSVFRATMDERSEEFSALAKDLSWKVMTMYMNSKQALSILGSEIASAFRKKIQSGLNPPLKQGTINRKGSSKPLIDTGQLLGSIDYEVEK